eukprot:3011475-Alexandrium_andersonii.AAC.1
MRSAPACSAHASCVPSTRVPDMSVSGCAPRICVLRACRGHSQAPLCLPAACRALRAAHVRALKHVCSARGVRAHAGATP